MRRLLKRIICRLLRRLLEGLETPEAPSILDSVTPVHILRLTQDEADLFRQVGGDAQKLARHFGDRQNSPTELKPREAEKIVTIALNAGNLMTKLANDQFPPKPPTPKETTGVAEPDPAPAK